MLDTLNKHTIKGIRCRFCDSNVKSTNYGIVIYPDEEKEKEAAMIPFEEPQKLIKELLEDTLKEEPIID